MQSYEIRATQKFRGSALIVTMTENRDGWRKDVENADTIFRSLAFSTELVWNPTSRVSLHKRSCLWANKCKQAKHAAFLIGICSSRVCPKIILSNCLLQD